MKVKFKRFSQHARLPTKATPGSACFDAYSARSVMVEPGVTKPFKTDFGLNFSNKYVTMLYPRSGLSLKILFLGVGVIDFDFRGIVCIIVTNLSQRTIEIEVGDRIAQMIFLKKQEIDFIEVEEFDDKTYFDTKGFGSTGIKPTAL